MFLVKERKKKKELVWNPATDILGGTSPRLFGEKLAHELFFVLRPKHCLV